MRHPRTSALSSQRFIALIGHVCRRKWGAGNIRLLAMYSPDGQRKDANTLAPPIEHPDILLEVLTQILRFPTRTQFVAER